MPSDHSPGARSEYDQDFVDETANTEQSTEYVYETYEDESEIQSGYDQDVQDGTAYTEPSTEFVDGTYENGESYDPQDEEFRHLLDPIIEETNVENDTILPHDVTE